ncbi:Ig-like domain-containing protein [bacterium]|nr:Ig-like domain-containing protein [bacterium]
MSNQKYCFKAKNLIFIVLGLLSCAKVEPPKGGEEDKISPEIIDFSPKNKSINLSLLPEIKITFSEKMDNESVEKAIFFIPEVKNLDFSWSGNTLKITPQDSLSKNKTYGFNVLSGVSDWHKVPMEKNFRIAFSTGNQIDTCKISGKTEGQSKAIVWCFKVEQDSVFYPKKSKITSYTKSDLQGNFAIENLTEGFYKIFAFTDKNKDEIFNRSKEDFAVWYKDILLDSLSFEEQNVNLVFTKNDTTQIKVKGIVPVYASKLRVNLTKKPFPDFLKQVFIKNFFTKDTLKIIDSYLNPLDSLQLVFEVSEFDSTKYIFDYSTQKDTLTYNFTGTKKKDNFAPKIISSLPQNKSDWMASENLLEVIFDEPILDVRLNKLITVVAITKKDTLNTQFQIKNINSTKTSIKLYDTFPDSTKILVKFPEAISDRFFNVLADTTLEFSVPVSKNFAKVSGKILLSESSFQNPVFRLLKAGSKEKINLELSPERTFKTNFLKIGSYVPMIFEDKNQNKQFDFGSDFPFEFSEKFYILKNDTLTVRQDWEYDNVIFNFEEN